MRIIRTWKGETQELFWVEPWRSPQYHNNSVTLVVCVRAKFVPLHHEVDQHYQSMLQLRMLQVNRVAKKMRTYFEMGTDGHRFLCFQFGIS